jgi:hypothetical protein
VQPAADGAAMQGVGPLQHMLDGPWAGMRFGNDLSSAGDREAVVEGQCPCPGPGCWSTFRVGRMIDRARPSMLPVVPLVDWSERVRAVSSAGVEWCFGATHRWHCAATRD